METPGKRKSKEFYSETMKKIANSQPVNREEIMRTLLRDAGKCFVVLSQRITSLEGEQSFRLLEHLLLPILK